MRVREYVVVRGVTGVLIAAFSLELRYIELNDLYQLFVIDTIMAVTKCSKQPNLPSYQLTSHLS